MEDVPQIGEMVTYVDPHGVSHRALVTAYWGGENPRGSANLVWVSEDETQLDSYGRQIARATSIIHRSTQSAPANFWE